MPCLEAKVSKRFPKGRLLELGDRIVNDIAEAFARFR
jgi:hypothetical protein